MMDTDELIRDQLRLRFQPIDTDEAWSSIQRRGKRVRRMRHLRTAVASLTIAGAAIAVVGTLTDRNDPDRVDAAGPNADQGKQEYGFAPFTPLVDAPLPVVPRTQLAVMDGHVLSVESAPERLGLILEDPSGSSGSSSSDPEATPALTSSGQGPSSQDPTPKSYVMGVTRAEVARIDWVRSSGTVSVATIAHDALPQLRFFIIEDTEGTFGDHNGDGPVPEPPLLRAFSADGTLLTDTERIRAEREEFYEEVDRRRGVEDKVAGVRDALVGPDDLSIVLSIFNCGEEPSPYWTEDTSTVTVSATVKLPYSADDCLSGETVEAHLGLNEPLAGRTIIDGRTGEPLLLRTGP